MPRWLNGQLLVALPTIGDPQFTRTVVLVVDHDEEGALGVVLNRPTDTAVEVAVPGMSGMFEEDEVVHEGGPVQPDALLTVAEFRDPEDAALLVLGRIGMVRGADGDEPPAVPGVDRARAYAGYAGWAPGQLEHELAADDWIIVDARPDDLFLPDASRLWHVALERVGGAFARLARVPADPSLN
ncbi:MAG: YqgE/AlgH family protein [Solirubrobacteraceae bacterium]